MVGVQAGKVCQRVCAMALEDRMAEKNTFQAPESFAGFCGSRQFEHVSGTFRERGSQVYSTQSLRWLSQQHPPWAWAHDHKLRALRSTDWARRAPAGREEIYIYIILFFFFFFISALPNLQPQDQAASFVAMPPRSKRI